MKILEFHAKAITEFDGHENSSGMLVMARGLGIDRILDVFIQSLSNPHNLVLLLNTSEIEFNCLLRDLRISSELAASDLPLERIEVGKLKSIDSETPASRRSELYLEGGVLAVTSRILVVDLLNKTIPSHLISGIIVNHAENVTETSSIAFILRLFRTFNKNGFIRALTDQPERMANEPTKLQRILKSLQIRNVYIYPRFHLDVANEIDSKGNVELIEIRVPFSQQMMEVQNALLDCLNLTLAEIRRLYPTLDFNELNIENSLFRSFDRVIRNQLDPVWHLTSSKTKQMVEDLKTLRNLILFLVNYDCVTFLQYLDTIREAGRLSREAGFKTEINSWLLFDAANIVFSVGKQRVYSKCNTQNSNAQQSLLPDCISPQLDIAPKWKVLCSVLKEIEDDRKKIKTPGNVLVLVPDGKIAQQIRSIIDKLDLTFKDKKRNKSVYATVLDHKLTQYFQNKTRAAEKFVAKPVAPNIENSNSGNKRRRVRNSKISNLQDNTTGVLYNQAISSEPAVPEGERLSKLHVIVRSFSTIEVDDTNIEKNHFNDIMPDWIILYSPDIVTIRKIEVYKAMHPEKKIKVYFFVYENSIEEQQYLTSLRKEKEAFETLIINKNSLSIPIDEAGNVVIDLEKSFWESVDSRQAGGQLTKKYKILVDVREFRSTLPMAIFSTGCDVIPCTLEVGDYILSPNIAVERKSPSDLTGSLKSGRLYKQAQAMDLGYKRSALLIEFRDPSNFRLMFSQFEKEMDVPRRLCLLCLHFPKLSILWCCSPSASAEVFGDLQKSEPAPDLEEAQAIGKDVEAGDTRYNPGPMEMLLNIPGISFKNYHAVMNKVKNLKELATLSKIECQNLIGSVDGLKLFEFFNTKF